MEKKSCRPVTVFSQQTVTKKSLTETNGNYTAKWKGKEYKLPQDYQGDSACAPVVYKA